MPPRTARSASREEDILAAAIEELNTMGVSLEWFGDIARRLGITRPALYSYFSDREDLQHRCYQEACGALEHGLERALAGHAHDIPAAVEAFLAERPGDGEQAVICELEALRPEQRDEIAGRLNRLTDRLGAVLATGIAAGTLRPMDTDIVANAIVSAAAYTPLLRRWGEGLDASLVSVGSVELVTRGMAADRRAPVPPLPALVPLAPARPQAFDRAGLEAAKRERILVVASAMFNRRGVGATRLEDVGEALGMNKRAIYYYVGSKQALVDACVQRTYGYFLDEMHAAEALDAPRSIAIHAAVRDLTRAAVDPDVSINLPYVGYGLLSEAARASVTRSAQAMYDGYVRLFAEGVAEGSIRPLPVEAVTLGLPSFMSWSPIRQFTPQAIAPRAQELADLALWGILAR
ncbi:TetR/AcrR family transcriptional regulator [Caulobacter sp. KR2-114]|uniref:TetR/AcrR family transcriptional regulator n=1 Tax=Caulobacter sp. KR2-114 TaxID=3400912 RepID=UPI003BFB7E47